MLNFMFFLISENLREHAGQVPRCVPAGPLRAAGGHPPHQPRHTHPLQADSPNTTKLMPQFHTYFKLYVVTVSFEKYTYILNLENVLDVFFSLSQHTIEIIFL